MSKRWIVRVPPQDGQEGHLFYVGNKGFHMPGLGCTRPYAGSYKTVGEAKAAAAAEKFTEFVIERANGPKKKAPWE